MGTTSSKINIPPDQYLYKGCVPLIPQLISNKIYISDQAYIQNGCKNK